MREELLEPYMPLLIGGGMVLALIAIVGWVLTTWLRIRHGYPLETSWGKVVEPRATSGVAERFRLIASENAQLKAELGAVKDRLATVERIVTDDANRLTQEIDALRLARN